MEKRMVGRNRRGNGGQTGACHRDPTSGRFEPGNPRGPGRPKGAGLKALIQESTRDGAELVEIMLSVARGQAMKVQGRRRGRTPRISERMEAIKYLTDRGWGRVPQEDGAPDWPENVQIIVRPSDMFPCQKE